MAIIPWNKKYRETLAVMLERFRSEQSQYRDSKITYAGRLDPLAEGLVILLTDDDVYKKQEFLELDKVYQVQFILGFETDSYDILGLVTNSPSFLEGDFSIKKTITSLEKITEQYYPPYSSKTVKGKPLWQWSREGRDMTGISPRQKIMVKYATYISTQKISLYDFNTSFIQTLTEVNGDFRQESIINSWEHSINTISNTTINVYTAEFHVSSGTYIRSLVHALGQQLATGAVCLKISRIQVGKYRV